MEKRKDGVPRESGTVFYPVGDLTDGEIVLRLKSTRNAQPEKQLLPAYFFDICLADGTKAGSCDLRIGWNEKIRISGNISYGIYPPWRGRHYAAAACRLLFRQARKHGMERLIITCDPSNRASSRTCELAGGRYTGTMAVPEDHELYAGGKRQVMVYRFDL